MFAEIILSQRFPKHLGIFDYKIPAALQSQIKIGQLVNIPFRSTEREGIIINTKKTSIAGKKIKAISAIVDTQPLLTAEQIELAKRIAAYYFVSLGTVIKMMLPPLPKRKVQITLPKFNSTPLTVSQATKKCISTIQSGKAKSMLYWHYTVQEQNQLIYGLIKQTKGTVLIIVPTVHDINFIASHLDSISLAKTAILHSQLNKNEYYRAYKNILNNKATIIIGTKLALFAPLQKLSYVIIAQEENRNHKQADQNPRFDSRHVAEELAGLHKSARLLYLSVAPRVSTYYLASSQHSIKIVQPQSNPDHYIQRIDLRDERKKGNYNIFSDLLRDSISSALEKNENNNKILLFINKRGSASSVLCRDCGFTIRCEQCQGPLIYHQTNDSLYCHRCNQKQIVPPFCPKCSGPNFKFIGTGTQTVQAEVGKLWPHARAIRVDKDSNTSVSNQTDWQIAIGTESVFPFIDWRKITLIGIVSADTFLYLPDFRSAERTWQLLHTIKSQTNAPLIIQTYSPAHPSIQNFITGKADHFYQTELHERQEWHYPPYTGLIKLSFAHQDKKTCLQEAERLYSVFKTSPLSCNIMTPLQPLVRGKWQMYVVIKYQPRSDEQLVRKLMSHVPDSWIIDRDPSSLL